MTIFMTLIILGDQRFMPTITLGITDHGDIIIPTIHGRTTDLCL